MDEVTTIEVRCDLVRRLHKLLGAPEGLTFNWQLERTLDICEAAQDMRQAITLDYPWAARERRRWREALDQLADNQHGIRRPAASIARAALAGDPLPDWGD